MESSTVSSGTARPLSESSRRRVDANGIPLRLADDHEWLLAVPRFNDSEVAFTSPNVDAEIDRIFEGAAMRGEVSFVDVWSAARALLGANYFLSDDEFVDLIYGVDAETLVSSVVESLFGPLQPVRSYCDWARASLVANGISAGTLGPSGLRNILTILVETGRTVPASRFIDASRAAEEQAALESLV